MMSQALVSFLPPMFAGVNKEQGGAVCWSAGGEGPGGRSLMGAKQLLTC